ncbi:hypothetical protein D3C72_1014860 [compost metagenome]
MGRVHGAEHLGSGAGEHFGIGVARGAGSETRIAEAIGGAPQQLDAAGFLVLLEVINHLREMVAILLQRAAFRGDIGVMEAVIVDTQFGEEFEGRGCFADRQLHGIAGVLPRALERPRTEHIGARPDERVPVTGGHAQVFAHGFAEDEFVGVVVTEGEGGIAVWAFVANRLDIREILHGPCPCCSWRCLDTSNGPDPADYEKHQHGVRFCVLSFFDQAPSLCQSPL